jgi:hypothetical protein
MNQMSRNLSSNRNFLNWILKIRRKMTMEKRKPANCRKMKKQQVRLQRG